MTKQIQVYTTSWCSDCKRSKAWMDAHSVSYKEINIEKDEKAVAFVQKINGGKQSVPTILFPDGSVLVEPSNKELEEHFSEMVE